MPEDAATVHVADLPVNVKAYTSQNPDGSYTILLNARHSYGQNKASYLHEVAHITGGDFHAASMASHIEYIRRQQQTADPLTRLTTALSLGQNVTATERHAAMANLAAIAHTAIAVRKCPHDNMEALFDKLRDENITLKYATLPGDIKGIYLNDGQPSIIINKAIIRLEHEPYLQRCIIAEQLGHHYTSKNSAFYCAANFPFWLLGQDKIKTRALTWSALYLIPYRALKTAKDKEKLYLLTDLAEYFQVTKELLLFRLAKLRHNDFLCDEDLSGM